MEFSIQLSAYYPDKSYGGDELYADMLEQAVLADSLGYDAVSLTEHHLINILMMPAPLQFAVRIADRTERIRVAAVVELAMRSDRAAYQALLEATRNSSLQVRNAAREAVDRIERGE